jgi:hypothetical protein
VNTADFLFPREFECTPTEFKKVIFSGSCLADLYVARLRKRNLIAIYDFMLFNNASDFPERLRRDRAPIPGIRVEFLAAGMGLERQVVRS